MAVRLHLKYGLVAEGDRLESSPDTILVTEPTAGVVLRSKGSLYIVVTARARSGGRPYEATALVAETIRREYYYDESAGIPSCLDKAIRTANRRLRHQREGQGLAPGSIGAVVAIVRGHELYVATIGDGEAYLVRQARLLTLPEEERGDGLPSPDDPHVDVWRGDLEVGDSLILVSRNLVRVVGTEELKNAVVTLHPQSAVEHLHHLFVAAGGDGSDAVLAVEATDANAAHAERRPSRPADAGDEAGSATRALPEPVAVAMSQAREIGGEVQSAVARGFWAVWDRLTDLLPRRRRRYRRVASLSARRDAQWRAAVAAFGFVAVVSVVGLSAWLIGGALAGSERDARASAAADDGAQALATARDLLDEVFGSGDMIADNEENATRLLREAWAELARAEEAGAAESDIEPLRRDVEAGLDRIYRTHRSETGAIYEFSEISPESRPVELVHGPDGAAYAIDAATASILRVDTQGKRAEVIFRAGEGSTSAVAEPWMLAVGGQDLVILDRAGVLWRWRSSGGGDGVIRQIRVVDAGWGEDVIDLATYLRSASTGLYNLYVVDPSARQVLFYEPAADGSGFPGDAQGRLSTATDLEDVIQVAIDGDIYVLTPEGLTRYQSGRVDGSFELEEPPDSADLRKGHEWGLVALTGGSKAGRIYLWDVKYRRVIEYQKSNGQYVQQFAGPKSDRRFIDLTGMYVDASDAETPRLYWTAGQRMWVTQLVPPPAASPSPSGEPAESGAPPSP